MRKALGKLETLFFAYVQTRRLRVVRTAELAGPLRLTAKQTKELLGRMARSGLIARVRRGLYLVPPQLPLGGKWTPDEAMALNALVQDQEGRYQICGPNAFNRYGFDGQIPARVYAYNNRLSGERSIGAVALTLIKVADDRLGDTEELATPDGTAVYSSRVRTLVDAVYDWSRFNGLPLAYGWIERELTARRVTPAELVACTLRYGNQGTIRRIGVLLEQRKVDAKLLGRLQRALKSAKSVIPWIPSRPSRGPVNPRWRVVLNGEDLFRAAVTYTAARTAFPARLIDSRIEAMAEKFRAALTRREAAIRDFYDLHYAVAHHGLAPGDPELLELVRRKLAVPGNDAVNVTPERLADLRAQLETQLRPVLRQSEFEAFDLDAAFELVRQVSAMSE